jgi:high-affinity Fe2+/Pb2+ permease
MSGEQTSAQTRLTLQSVGLTLLGVILSIGVTVGFGLSGPWWLRLFLGVATTVGLVVAVGLLGRKTKALRRLADWIMGSEDDGP